MRRFSMLPLTVLVALTVLSIGCGADGSASAHFENGTGTVNVHMTDAPIDLTDVQSVMVSIDEVTVYPREDSIPEAVPGSPIVLLTHPETFDLLTLTGGASTLLATGEVPAGSYSRIRLGITEATLVYQDGTTEPLKIDSNKVDVPIGFHVDVDATSQVTLDFDAAASVQVNETGTSRFILRPVVTPVQIP